MDRPICRYHPFPYSSWCVDRHFITPGAKYEIPVTETVRSAFEARARQNRRRRSWWGRFERRWRGGSVFLTSVPEEEECEGWVVGAHIPSVSLYGSGVSMPMAAQAWEALLDVAVLEMEAVLMKEVYRETVGEVLEDRLSPLHCPPLLPPSFALF